MHLILEWTQCMTHRNGPQIRGYCCIFVRISTAPIFLKIKLKALRICGCICRVFYGSTNTDLRIGMSGDLDIQKYYVYCKEKKKRFFTWEYVEIDSGKHTISQVGHTPPPGEHLGLFCGNQKTHFFASFATNGNTARVKIPP